MHSLQSYGVLAGSWFAVSHQEAGFPAALQLSLSLLSTHTTMVPAWRGNRGREAEEGGHEERDSRSLTHSIVTYGDKSDVKLMIGVDGERERKRGRDWWAEGNVEIPTKIYSPWSQWVIIKGDRQRPDRQIKCMWLCRVCRERPTGRQGGADSGYRLEPYINGLYVALLLGGKKTPTTWLEQMWTCPKHIAHMFHVKRHKSNRRQTSFKTESLPSPKQCKKKPVIVTNPSNNRKYNYCTDMRCLWT